LLNINISLYSYLPHSEKTGVLKNARVENTSARTVRDLWRPYVYRQEHRSSGAVGSVECGI